MVSGYGGSSFSVLIIARTPSLASLDQFYCQLGSNCIFFMFKINFRLFLVFFVNPRNVPFILFLGADFMH